MLVYGFYIITEELQNVHIVRCARGGLEGEVRLTEALYGGSGSNKG